MKIGNIMRSVLIFGLMSLMSSMAFADNYKQALDSQGNAVKLNGVSVMVKVDGKGNPLKGPENYFAMTAANTFVPLSQYMSSLNEKEGETNPEQCHIANGHYDKIVKGSVIDSEQTQQNGTVHSDKAE